ncbi:protein O-mannosyl-transferase TMTC4-like [Rhipicephalus sanguineus]|uniref:protein O-mannosyl-transferase TMTC4-like n=1 Tax=Rhipicephalus sanguineus TaxID=34632 RepID=UPI0020C2694C|nr:protein O-mannosyl-transferase TMTC4-like [Rhipicephalus sanguineus]
MVRVLAGSLSAACASMVARTRSYIEHPTKLRVASSSTVPVEDQELRQRRSSSHSQRRQQPQQQRAQKRYDAGVYAAKVPTCVDCGVRRRWCLTAWVPAFCAGVLAVLCYVNSLDGDFVHDDMVAVVGNSDVTGESRRHASSSSSSLWINDFWGRPMADPRSHKSYRPLTVLSFRANYYANGLQVRGYHLVNVALHCACSVLVAVVARRVMRITALHACLAAMLFAAHPAHTEAVSSIVGRAEVLCCLFFLLSFLCYHRCQLSSDYQRGHGRSKWLAACALLSVCALLSKEQGITVLPLCATLRIRTLLFDSTRPQLQR